jgi:CheY-like chemotaxis protein
VDDEATIRRLLARFLRGRGCTVDEVADGGEALVRLQAAEYDVVISDVSMPGLDGATLWMRACMARPALRDRWVFVSALPLPRVLAAAQLRHVAKPFDLEAVWREVRAVAGGANAEGPRTSADPQ